MILVEKYLFLQLYFFSQDFGLQQNKSDIERMAIWIKFAEGTVFEQ